MRFKATSSSTMIGYAGFVYTKYARTRILYIHNQSACVSIQIKSSCTSLQISVCDTGRFSVGNVYTGNNINDALTVTKKRLRVLKFHLEVENFETTIRCCSVEHSSIRQNPSRHGIIESHRTKSWNPVINTSNHPLLQPKILYSIRTYDQQTIRHHPLSTIHFPPPTQYHI